MEDGQRHNISRHVCSWGKLIQIALLQGAGECQGNVARGKLSFRPNLVQRILQHLYRIALRTTDCLHAWVKVPKSGKGKKKAKAVNKDRHIRWPNDLVKCFNSNNISPIPTGLQSCCPFEWQQNVFAWRFRDSRAPQPRRACVIIITIDIYMYI